VAPTPKHIPSCGFTGEKITNTYRDDHEEIACEVVSVDEGSCDRANQTLSLQIEDLSVAAEEFKYPVERFPSTDYHDDDNELTSQSMAIPKRLPVKEKDKQPYESKPFEEIDLGHERNERKGKTR